MPTNKQSLSMSTLLILALAYSVRAYTDITKNNCPDSFDIASANTSEGSGRSDIASFFYSPFTDPATMERVRSIIIETNTDDLNNLVMDQYAIPFIALAAVFGLTIAIVLLCVVFEKSCPPCHSWRRDFAKRPYEKFEIRCVAFFSVLFSLAILGTTIAAFTVIPRLADEVESTKCALYASLDVALNGDDLHWGGFSHIKDQVGNISLLLPSASTQINSYFDDDEAIQLSMSNMRQNNLEVYSSYKDAKVETPDPNATAAALQTDSYFILNTLGPNGTTSTMTDSLDLAFAGTAGLSDQANQIINSAFLLRDSSTTIQANTAASQTTLEMYETQLNQYKADLDEFANTYFDPFFNWGIYTVQVVVGLILVGSLAILIGSVSIQVLDIYDCRHFLHFGWVLFGITYFGVVFIAFFALPMGSLGYAFCDYYAGMLSNQTDFQLISNYDPQHILNRMDVCIYGDGNVLQKFNIAQEMDTVSQLFVNIDLFNEYEDSTSDKYIDQALSQTEITTWVATLTDLRDGVTKDVDVALTTDANAMHALENMVGYSLWTTANAGDSSARCTRDRWVYDQVDCLNSDHIFDNTVDDPNAINMGYVTCYPLNVKPTIGSAGIWTFTDFTDRYKQIRYDCEDSYDIVMGYAKSILLYRDSRIDLFQSLIDELTSLRADHDGFDLVMTSFRSNLALFESTQSIKDLSNFVTNEIDGLLVSSQCEPIGDYLRFIQNSFCVNAIGHTVDLGICMMLLLALLIGGVFTTCVFAQRTATIKRLFTIHEKNFALAENSVHSETFDRKKSESSESSSSSDQD